jgi:hypothetical protein
MPIARRKESAAAEIDRTTTSRREEARHRGPAGEATPSACCRHALSVWRCGNKPHPNEHRGLSLIKNREPQPAGNTGSGDSAHRWVNSEAPEGGRRGRRLSSRFPALVRTVRGRSSGHGHAQDMTPLALSLYLAGGLCCLGAVLMFVWSCGWNARFLRTQWDHRFAGIVFLLFAAIAFGAGWYSSRP